MKPMTDMKSDDIKVNVDLELANDKGWPGYSALGNLIFSGAENKDKPGYTVDCKLVTLTLVVALH